MQQDDNEPGKANTKNNTKEFSEIIHTMRHDVRNFIAAIDGYAWLLKEEFNVDYVNRIISNISNITTVVDRSVALIDAELEVEKITEINLYDLVKSLHEVIPEEVNVQTDQLFKVKGDYTRIQFMFKTILENAVQHGEPKTIEITSSEQPDGQRLVAIVNDGKKISPEMVKELFIKMPQTLKPNSGLNLIIAKKIALAHGWDLRYNSQVTDKTCFEIIIGSDSIIK